ncbi:hypothetical protein FlaCF_0549 [Flavobacterium tructae]
MIKMRKAVVTDSLSFVLFCFVALSGVEGSGFEGRTNWNGGLRLRSAGQSFDFVWSDKALISCGLTKACLKVVISTEEKSS